MPTTEATKCGFCSGPHNENMKNEFNRKIVEVHKFTVIEPIEEIYPETNQKMVRPDINVKRVIFKALTLLAILFGISFLVSVILPVFDWYKGIDISSIGKFFLIFLIFFGISMIVLSKRIVVFLIRVYQRYAPYEVRCMCLFIPCCSEYMILAIKKYGLIKGVVKGIGRYRRCHEPNGGVDYP